MRLGKGIKDAAADKLVGKLAGELRDGEEVMLVCACNNLKPMVDRVVLTDARLLAVSALDGKVGFAAERGELSDVVVDSGWSGATVAVARADGDRMVLKGMDKTDAEGLGALLTLGEGAPPVPHAAAEPVEPVAPVEPAEPGLAAPGPLAQAKDAMRAAYRDHREASAALAASNTATYGRLVQSGQFGFKTVEIYESGHVRVGLLLTQKSPFEKLRSISFTVQVQDRSGAGHLWASGGLGSREKRVLLLTIATDQQVHTLSTEGEVGRSEDKVGLALEAAGKGVLAELYRAPAPPPEPAALPVAGIAEQLREIAVLHREGVLSDEEFAAAKARLLGQL